MKLAYFLCFLSWMILVNVAIDLVTGIEKMEVFLSLVILVVSLLRLRTLNKKLRLAVTKRD